MKTVLLFLLLSVQALAQLNIIMKPTKTQFVAHEEVTITLSITNRAGKTILLQGAGLQNWLNIDIRDSDRNLLPYKGTAPTFKGVKIAAGETVQKSINISDFYDLSRYGNYSIVSLVTLPGDTNEAARSNSSRFTITNGRVLATQKIGIPGTATARRYEVIKFNGDSRIDIYVKVTNDYTKRVISCEPISKITGSREPKIAIDKGNNLHLLYMITHSTYVHHTIAPTGKITKRTFYKEGAYGEPRLEAFAKGDVKVAGATPYDPAKARKASLEGRKLSDRPNF